MFEKHHGYLILDIHEHLSSLKDEKLIPGLLHTSRDQGFPFPGDNQFFRRHMQAHRQSSTNDLSRTSAYLRESSPMIEDNASEASTTERLPDKKGVDEVNGALDQRLGESLPESYGKMLCLQRALELERHIH